MPHTPQVSGSCGSGLCSVRPFIFRSTPLSSQVEKRLITFTPIEIQLGLAVSPAPCRHMLPMFISPQKGMLQASVVT